LIYFLRSKYVIINNTHNVSFQEFYTKLLQFQRCYCPLESVEAVLMDENLNELNRIIELETVLKAHLDRQDDNSLFIIGLSISSNQQY